MIKKYYRYFLHKKVSQYNQRFFFDRGTRNGFMLHKDLGKPFGIKRNSLHKKGYDWWWHSFTAVNQLTGEEQPFFIEYYVINPGLGGAKPILGQSKYTKKSNLKPSYAMIKAGTWVLNDSRQIHNFYGIKNFFAHPHKMDVRIGDNIATEKEIRGSVSLSEEEAEKYPEYMSQHGTITWNLKVKKVLSYYAGYAASEFFTSLNLLSMWWHVAGLKTLYEGEVIYNGQVFDVIPELSYGYQDKNWGTDYTNPWIWLSCNNFTSEKTGQHLSLTSLDVGGGIPKALGFSLGKKALVIFYHEGKLYEYNFSKPWLGSKTQYNVKVTEEDIRWNITANNLTSKITISFSNPKNKMLKINYENPEGKQNHRELWNGGHASGTVRLYKKNFGGFELIDTFIGKNGGVEYGSYK